MSLQDSLFAEEAENDVTLFAEDAKRKRVLVFPPVNAYRRFIIHRLVQNRFVDLLKTFSIGQGDTRRTVVCYRSDLLSEPTLKGVPLRACAKDTGSFSVARDREAMGLEEARCLPTEDSTFPEHSRMRQVKMSPVVEIYRPPAARRASRDGRSSSTVCISDDSCTSSAKGNNRQRRPDRAVYVPKHRRSTEADESAGPDATILPTCLPTCRVRCARAGTNSPSIENEPFRKHSSPHERNGNEEISGDAAEKRVSCLRVSSSSSSSSASSTELWEKNDEPRETGNEAENHLDVQESAAAAAAAAAAPPEESNVSSFHGENDSDETRTPRSLSSCSNDTVEDDEIGIGESRVKNPEDERSTDPPEDASDASDAPLENRNNEANRESGPRLDSTRKTEEQRETRDRDRETNNKNLRTSSYVVSNVLIISDPKERQDEQVKTKSVERESESSATVVPVESPPEKKLKKVARVKSKPASPPSPPIKLNRDECDWDSLFDDNGECLDPTLIEELTAAVGRVTIERPKNDYKPFTRPVRVSNDEFAHVVEIYNFPSDFKTCDLAAVFGPWKNAGFELKWVDDTHCLGVFSSPLVAAEVLGSDHPFVKTRPLSAATSLSKTKARKSVEFLQPYKRRPQTCAALARRLVTGALGVKLATARQEREEEKLLLREAKEKRRLANKQREDVWEGIIAEK